MVKYGGNRFDRRRFGKRKFSKHPPLKAYRYRPRPRRPLSYAQPQQMVIKMRYAEEIAIDPGASGAIAGAVYRANGLFDPSVTFAGHQPMSYDTWLGADGSGSLYKEFCVIGAKISVEFIATTATENNRVGVLLGDSSSVPTANGIANEQRANRESILGPNTGGNGYKKLTKTFSAKKWFRHPSILSERDTLGTYGADPTRQAYFVVYATGIGGVDSTAIRAIVTIDYVVVLREPAALPQS